MQLLVLGNRVPVLAPDAWVAPNAVVIGDVDLFDKVWGPRKWCCPIAMTLPAYGTACIATPLYGTMKTKHWLSVNWIMGRS